MGNRPLLDADGGARIKPLGWDSFELKAGRWIWLPIVPGVSPLKRPDDFRAKATECDKLADEVQEPEAKRTLQEAAKNWRVLADQVERWQGSGVSD